jgi:sigma-B regulation protein RsbU (phosphoserine phosphatase)
MALPSARVLIVDDIAENRELLVRRLKRLWIDDIDEAVNGVEALAAIGRKNYDIVLLDIMMPEMDGFGVLEQLKADGRINDLPVIVISAMNEIDPMVRCIELGAEDFIFKPFNPTLLRARIMATLEKKALRDQTREELRRSQRELKEARTLQLALVPPAFRGNCGGFSLSIDVALEPAKEVGGDLVDHFRVGDLVVLALGDVSDKGAGAALMMARTHSMFRSLSMRPDADALFRDPAAAVGLVNTALAKANESCMFVTFLLATFDPASGEFRYLRAGHVPPFVRRENGAIERPGHQGGLPLGLVEDGAYTSDAVILAPGDRVLVITDGFTEAHDLSDNLFGETMVESFLAELTKDTAAPLELLTAQVKTFEAGQPAADDMAAFLFTLGAATSP